MRPGRVIVSGGDGFVGRHLLRSLKDEGVDAVAPSRRELDFCDDRAVRSLVGEAPLSTIFHLAAFSSPSLSWDRPAEAVLRNLEMTLNVLEAVRHEAPAATVVLVGTGQVYGESVDLPATEVAPLSPSNPYATSKASGDMLGRQYAERHGMTVVRMRPFNHAGPGQSDEYVVSSFAHQVAAAEAGGDRECLLRTGRPEVARDITDVRDVVRAYSLASELDSGVFNVCRGSATSIAELVQLVSSFARIPVKHEVDPSRVRLNEAPTLYGSHQRLSEACGWSPLIPVAQTVEDTLDWWRATLAS